ncbi:MAG: hypothetical protein HQL40_04755 [Alphaproteobacteria bacterium]|nr:hypothetical protein [Alphaproteobacteria bacterium]
MDYQDLCRAALDRFGARCFDNLAIDREGRIDREQARLIARTLRLRGGRDGFLLGREIEAVIRDGGEETVVQWMDDTVVRFFPVVEDPVFVLTRARSRQATNPSSRPA